MNQTFEPLVSVVTPLYNSEKFLSECIESILTQRYENWEYVILNNCSKDDSLRIAQSYAKKDVRIRVVDNEEFLPMVENWNHSFELLSSDSKYCKIVHADDILFPECISNMVALAEENRSVGIVSSYVLEGVRVKCDGLPYSSPVVSGRKICRWSLLNTSPVEGGLYLFGSPTSLLIRSDLIRSRKPFYNDRYLQVVDQEVCYYLLQNTDFGFVHQTLTYTRLHSNTMTSTSSIFNRRILEELMLLIDYGPVYLSGKEYEQRVTRRMDKYYRFLAHSVFEKRDGDFWDYHKNGLKSLGLPLKRSRLIKGTLLELARRSFHRIGSLVN